MYRADGRGIKQAVSLAACLMILAALAPRSAVGAESGVSVLGSFNYKGPLYADPRGRLLYQVSRGLGSVVDIMDLDTLEVRRTVELPVSYGGWIGGGGTHRPATLAAVDSFRHRLFVPYLIDGLSGSAPSAGVAVLDGPSGNVSSFALRSPEGAPMLSASYGIEAMAYWGPENLLYLLYAPARGSAPGRLYVQEVDAATGNARWSFEIPGCSDLFADNSFMPPFGRGGNNIYIGCIAGGHDRGFLAASGLVPTASIGTGTVIKIPLRGNQPSGGALAFAAPDAVSRGLFDSASERMFLEGGLGFLEVFDGTHETWVGLVRSGKTQLGINPELGRIYLCYKKDSGGVSVTDAAVATPVPFARDFPVVDCDSSLERIETDPVTGRVFVKSSDRKWTVLEDRVVKFESEPRIDYDSGAENIQESPGVTRSSFAGDASGYGTRLIWVRGPLGTFDNVSALLGSIMRGLFADETDLRFQESSRFVTLGNVSQVNVTTDGVRAGAISADRDNRFHEDLENLRQYPYNPSDEPRWRYETSICRAFGGDTDLANDQHQGDFGGTSTVSCDLEVSRSTANATAPQLVSSPILSVGEAYSEIDVHRDPERGIVATVESVSRNVNIAGSLFIAEARAVLTSWAGGHPAEAGTSYDRTFSGIKLLGSDGNPIWECSQECIPQQAISVINQLIGPRMIARLPEPDPELIDGTPKGTTASFRQNYWQLQEQRVLFDKPESDLTMPALEVTVNGNVFSNSGYVVQLAGVSATTAYRIFSIPQAGAFPSIPPMQLGLQGGGLPQIGPVIDEGPATFLRKVVERIRTGLKWVFALGGNAPSVLAAWLLLLSPLYFVVRRRLLLRNVPGAG